MESVTDQNFINSQALALDNWELHCIQLWLNGDNIEEIALRHNLGSRTVEYLIVNSCAKMAHQARSLMSVKTV